MIDRALHQKVLRENSQDRFFCAHVALSGLPGAGAFLTAPPVDDGREIDASLFKISLKRRLRAPVFDAEHHCPLCGEVVDRFGDHALVCGCGGDRTVRHNAIRNICYQAGVEAGLRPEREKANLLRGPSPDADGLPSNAAGNGSRGGRRPADV